MSGKPLEYWRKKYNTCYLAWSEEYRNSPPETWAKDFCQASSIFWLLAEYSSANYSGLWGITGGDGWSRFWAGRWGTNHGNQVTKTLHLYQNLPKKEQTVANLISILHQQLTNSILSPNGDLSRIVKVVEEKTGVTFADDRPDFTFLSQAHTYGNV